MTCIWLVYALLASVAFGDLIRMQRKAGLQAATPNQFRKVGHKRRAAPPNQFRKGGHKRRAASTESSKSIGMIIDGKGRGASRELGALTQRTSKWCNEKANGRKFSYFDADCGKQAMNYSMQDLLKAFHVEESYWNEQGFRNPWFAVNTHLPLGSDLPKEAKLKFYESGTHHIETVEKRFIDHGYDIFKAGASSALDLGCGLGRLGHGLAAHGFSKVICVDQADSMLDAAKKNLKELAGQGVVMADFSKHLEFLYSGPDLMCSVPAGSVNFVHSWITLQHMKPMLQVAYIEQLCDVLKDDGMGFFQIPTFMKKEPVANHCKLDDEVEAMAMHYTKEDEVKKHLAARGCTVLFQTDEDAIGNLGKSQGFAFQKAHKDIAKDQHAEP